MPINLKEFIYLACCCLGNDYIDKNDKYYKEESIKREKETLCTKKSLVEYNTTICFPTLSQNKNGKKKEKRIKWIIGDDYFNNDD